MSPKSWFVGAALVAALASPVAALADSCSNASRPAPQPGTGTTVDTPYGPAVVKGNSVYAGGSWDFITPGTNLQQLAGVNYTQPDANGNFTDGKTHSLLGNTPICQPGSTASTARQTTNGIQSGCY